MIASNLSPVGRAFAGWICVAAWWVCALLVPFGHALGHDPHDHVHTATGTIAHAEDAEHSETTDTSQHYATLVLVPVRSLPELVDDGYARLVAGESLDEITGVHIHGGVGDRDAHAHEHHAHEVPAHDRPALSDGAPSEDGVGHADGPAHLRIALVRVAAALVVLRMHPEPGALPAATWRSESPPRKEVRDSDPARGPPTPIATV